MAKTPHVARAEHFWIGSDGVVVDAIENATGIRYVSKESGGNVDFQVPEGPQRLWLAVFGARTLSVNEASAARQDGGNVSDQLDAIRARFDLIASGQWIDRSRAGGGFRVDKDALAHALADVAVRSKKLHKDSFEDGKAKIRAQIESKESADLRALLKITGVRDAYDRARGVEVATLDDLSALLG